jgi:hypothetical protein
MSISVVKLYWWCVVKCSEVLQYNDGTSNKVSNIYYKTYRDLLLQYILQLSHSLIYFRFIFCEYMVEFLFNNVIYVFMF